MSAIPQRVHLVGIGGMHMSAIARILLARGHIVSGSDLRASHLTQALAALGAAIHIGAHDASFIGDAQLVVATSAATADNPEINIARRRGIEVIKRADMVARLMQGRQAVCIAGCHGKSTTSGLVAHLLRTSGRDPTYLIGAELVDTGDNAAPGSGPHIVVEADEYDRAFLSYQPDVALVTNVEPDHLDYYKTWQAVQEAFADFAARVRPGGMFAVCADDAEAMRLRSAVQRDVNVTTYGLSPDAEWRASALKLESNGGHSFDVHHRGEFVGRFTTVLPIRHNVVNALGAIVVARRLGLGIAEISAGLTAYHGVRRRFEVKGEAGGVLVIDDYAHHPTEIRDTAAAAREAFPGRRSVALFQPHTYARTRYLLDGFRTCFRDFDLLYLLETYAAREAIADGMTAEQLASEIEPRPGYVRSFEEAADALAAVLRPGDVFFTIGAGDVDNVGPMVLQRLAERAREART